MRPDLVLFLTDQQRFDQVGYASDGHFETPAIDSLAEHGTAFEHAYSASTVCAPARMSLLTGLLHHRVQKIERRAIREGFWTVPRALRADGYQTALVGKMHMSPVHADHGFEIMRMCEHRSPVGGYQPPDSDDYHPWLEEQGLAHANGTQAYRPHLTRAARERRGKGVFPTAEPYPFDIGLHPTSWVEREAVEVLEQRDPDRPLFLVVSFPHPHAPVNPPEPYASMYDPADSLLPADGFEVNEALPFEYLYLCRGSTLGFGNSARIDRDDEPAVRNFLALVRGLVRQIDDAIGRVVDLLDLGRTTVFFTSDHGDYAGHRGLMEKNPWFPFEDLARVPFVVSGAGVEAQRVSTPTSAANFGLTCLDLAGVDEPAVDFDTTTLRPVLSGEAPDGDCVVRCVTRLGQRFGWVMARRGDLKYIHSTVSGTDLLFDLAADPVESVNRIGDASYATEAAALLDGIERSLAQPVPDELSVT